MLKLQQEATEGVVYVFPWRSCVSLALQKDGGMNAEHFMLGTAWKLYAHAYGLNMSS